MRAKQLFKVGSWSIMPFDVQHDVAEYMASCWLMRTVTSFCLPLIPITSNTSLGLTHIMVECNYSNEILNENIKSGRTPPFMKRRLLQSHFSLENVKEFLKANDLSRVQEIWLLHLSESNSDEELFKEDIMKLTGKVVYIP